MAIGWACVIPPVMADHGMTVLPTPANIAAGRQLVLNRKAANCIACHQVEGATMAGDIAQPLEAPFPGRDRLFAQIWDARQNYANTIMPPYGANHMLTRRQILQIMDFLYSLNR